MALTFPWPRTTEAEPPAGTPATRCTTCGQMVDPEPAARCCGCGRPHSCGCGGTWTTRIGQLAPAEHRCGGCAISPDPAEQRRTVRF